MAQTKKTEVRDAILASARRLLHARGYHRASMAQIASGAGISAANIYVYFSSKLEILFALYDPWLRARLLRLENELQLVDERTERLRLILKTLWLDIPSEENGFANNLMQALSSATPKDQYSRDLLSWVEDKISDLLRDALPPARRHLIVDGGVAHILLMAFDGFVMSQHLGDDSASGERALDAMLAVLAEPAQ